VTDLFPVEHGRIRVHLPGDWEDRSTLLFLAPAHAGPAAPMSAKAPAKRHRNLSITLDRTDAESAEQFVKKLLGVATAEPIELAARAGACAARRVQTPDGWVRQLVAAAIVEPGLVLLAIASVDEGSFEAHRAELVGLMGRIEFD
jgi:hypothetical protein